MSDFQPVCPKCQTAMEEGFAVDRTDSGARLMTWQSGKPIPVTILGIIRMGVEFDPDALPIAMYRCPNCGFLESYAR